MPNVLIIPIQPDLSKYLYGTGIVLGKIKHCFQLDMLSEL